MKLRTVYFKVPDMQEAVKFYSTFLEMEAHKSSAVWSEFQIGEVRLGLLSSTDGNPAKQSNCVPIFEFEKYEIMRRVDAVTLLGARIIADGLDDPGVQSITLADPFGNEFEVSRVHD
jgi:predicted enzyme related to lactoylglutathione lyase